MRRLHRAARRLAKPVALVGFIAVFPLATATSCAESESPAQSFLDAGGPDSNASVPTTESCEAGAFCAVALPLSPVSLNGIWGSGPDDVWIVGSPSMTIHWDGAQFSRAAINKREALLGVWGSGRGDVWAFGTTQTLWHSQGFEAETGGWSKSSGTTGIYDGAFATPILAMWGSGANDVWAVGASAVRGINSAYPSVAHCDGWRNGEPDWQVSPTGKTDHPIELEDGGTLEVGSPVVENVNFSAICGNESTGIWIVGHGGKTRYTNGWKDNAAEWTSINSHSARELYAVWCSPDGDVWATGEAATMRRFTRGDGGGYVGVTVETPVSTSLRAFWGSAPDDLWAVGDGGAVIHWDGKAWSLASAPGLEQMNEDLFAVWGSSKDDVWFAGRNVLLHKGSTLLPEKIQ
jgi:hypothetical protein